MFGRDKPAFRSPAKILEDLAKLGEQGVYSVFLFQDPTMGGRKYWKELLCALKSDKSDLSEIVLELFEPPPSEFLEGLSSLRERIRLTISPESGVDSVRKAHGRTYTNEEILSTSRLCMKLGLRLTAFFMIGLAEETYETVEQTSRLWEQFYAMRCGEPQGGGGAVKHAVGSMILLDPGSLAFDHPEKYGYKLLFKNLRDYISGMLMPSWHQWVSYETRWLSRKDIATLTLHALTESILVREKYGLYSIPSLREKHGLVSTPELPELPAELYFTITHLSRIIIDEVDRAMQLSDATERQNRLRGLNEALKIDAWQTASGDPYEYKLAIWTALHKAVGLLDASS